MRLAQVVSIGVAAGALAAACGGGSSNRLANPDTLASAVQDSVQHKLDSGTSGLPAGTKVTQVRCVNTRRLDFTCDVRFNTGGARSVMVTVAPGGRSYVVTAGDL